MEREYYFAYGSNMWWPRLKGRCPDAIELGTGKLGGYAVVERLYADIERKAGSKVSGRLYALTAADFAALDICEGAPNVYRRIRVRIITENGSVSAYTYIMTKEARKERDGQRYSEQYRQICSLGAESAGINNPFERKINMEDIKVAVYGTLMKGERNEWWGADASGRQPCVIHGTIYDTGYGYPAFVPGEHGDVQAELLSVDKRVLAKMDQLEGYPSLYDREVILVDVGDRKVEAFVYVMNRMPFGAKRIMCGDWREYRKNNRK